MIVRRLGLAEYEPTWRRMQQFTAVRDENTEDEIWLLEHPPVFTLGQAGKMEHLLCDMGIPVIKVDRGGQITYHGPGQLVAYLLIDLRRRDIKVREMVRKMEQALIDLLAEHGIDAQRLGGAPGVYVDGAKIAALGLRVKNGCSFHGLALNVDMDLTPYQAINPCGYAGMAVTQMKDELRKSLIKSVRGELVEPRADFSSDVSANYTMPFDRLRANGVSNQHTIRQMSGTDDLASIGDRLVQHLKAQLEPEHV